MTDDRHQLSDVLDRLEQSLEHETSTIGEVVDQLGHKSFASLMLIFCLICTSPASAIPGLTAVTAALVFMLVVQMIIGRKNIWLPAFILNRSMSTKILRKGIGWLRRPVHFIERFLKPRLEFLLHRPWSLLPLFLILALTLFMPFMEVVPTSGSIASAIIALFAIGKLTHDGAFVLLSIVLLAAIPLALYGFGFV